MVSSCRDAPVVLLLDDDHDVRAVVASMLEGEGYRVIEAENAGEALGIARDPEVPIRLLVTDVMMPGIDGPEAARRMRAVRPELPVLYISGYTGWAGTSHQDAPGELLPKPFTTRRLAAAVARALRH